MVFKKNIRYLKIISLLVITAVSFAPFAYSGTSKCTITAKAAIVMDVGNKKILYSQNPHLKLPPASTAKLVTAMVVLDRLKLSQKVYISKKAASVEPTKAYLSQGAYYRTDDLVAALLIKSANDAGIALAEAVAGSEDKFARLMNKKARSLGAKNSDFKNSTGLPSKGQYSTAYDMALIIKAATRYPYIKKVLMKKSFSFTGSTGRKKKISSHNKLLWETPKPSVIGKTGYTFAAKRCFAGIAFYKKRKVAVVVLKSDRLWWDVKNILWVTRPKKLTRK
jgi:D-alanyl-D-alanine carboxypeptidase